MSLGRPRFTARRPGQPPVGRRASQSGDDPTAFDIPDGLMSNADLGELISSLTSKEVRVNTGAVLEGADPIVVSMYVDDDSMPGALLVADVGGAASIGGALTLTDPSEVEEARKKGRLNPALMDNWAEVANILTQVLRVPGFPDYRFSKTEGSWNQLSGDITSLLTTARFRAGWMFDVPDYGKGKLSIYLARKKK